MIGLTRNRFAAAVGAMLISFSAVADPPSANHPILGTWLLTRPRSPCVETEIYGSGDSGV